MIFLTYLIFKCPVAACQSPSFTMSQTDHPRRSVRTFVRRQGRMSSAMRQALVTLAGDYELEPVAGERLDLARIYGRVAPRILEIGFGNGNALIQMAQQHPQQDYLGVEVHRPGMANVFMCAQALALTNVRIISADAQDVLLQHINDESFDAIYIFFPDPWPKQKHRKRRLIQLPFVELLVRKLRAGGRLHLATDWQDYARQMLRVIEQHPRLTNLAGAGAYSPRPEYRPLTKYEQRGVRQGHVVRDLCFEKIP